MFGARVLDVNVASADIFERLTTTLREVFENNELIATPQLTAREVEGWDSLGNIRLFIELERVFSVRFGATEIAALGDVGQLAELIERKVSRAAR